MTTDNDNVVPLVGKKVDMNKIMDTLWQNLQEDNLAEAGLPKWSAYECKVAGKIFWEVVTPDNLTDMPYIFTTVDDVVSASRLANAIVSVYALETSYAIYGEE